MTLRDMAVKNIRGNFNKYIMYYLSNTLVVMIFFIFANFIFNPTVADLKSFGFKGALAANTMILCEFVIVVFAIFFTRYSTVNFIKSREKEFGLLAMCGLTQTQIRKFVMYENLIVSTVSVITGLLFGILFSKLFFMAITVIMALETEILFIVSVKAVLITVGSFLILFQGISFISSFKIKKNNIVNLLKGSRIPKPVPRFSVAKTIIAIVCIAAGYLLAVFSGMTIIITMFPILALTITGTYFLFSQFSIFITNKMKNNKKLFYKGVNMITLSQIIYKLSDNARILFNIAIIGAVALTASASVYSVEKSFVEGIEANIPQDLCIVEHGVNTHNVLPGGKVEEVLKRYGKELEFSNEVVMLKAQRLVASDKNDDFPSFPNKKDFYLISNKDFNEAAKYLGRQSYDVKPGEIVFCYFSSFLNNRTGQQFPDAYSIRFNINGNEVSYKLQSEFNGNAINPPPVYSNVIVLNDNDFSNLASKIGDENKFVYYGYNIRNWYNAEAAVKDIAAMVSEENKAMFNERVTSFASTMQVLTLFLFIGAFIAILFFIANGSIIYFKMFNEIMKDREEFVALKKMGMADKEMKKVISIQAFILFFSPYIIAFLHATFALIALSNLLQTNLMMYFLVVAAVYLIFLAGYYTFSKTMYMKQIRNMEI